MTFLADESSIESSEPREGVEFILPTATTRIATGVKDVTIDGNLYSAVSARREEVKVSASGSPHSIVVSLPISHALCQRYMAGGCPPRTILVNVWRHQRVSGLAEKIFTGHVTSLAPDDNVGRFLVPSRSAEAFERRLPTVTAGKMCPHVLFDVNCKVPRLAFTSTTVTVTAISGSTLTLSSDGGFPDDYAKFGELLHVASGETMTILSQIDNVVTIQMPIYGVEIGDSITMTAGCAHTIATCKSKFINVINFGGQPELPTENPHIPNGFGVYQSAAGD